jgi:polar amino acid transport system substrate-binding protein
LKTILFVIFILFSTLYAQETQQHTIKIAFGFDKPPFVFGKNTLKGIEPDLIQESFALMNYKVEAVRMTKDKLSKILDTPNDIEAVSTITPHNPKLFASDDFTSYENYAISRKSEHLHLQSIDDLKYVNFVTWNGAYNDLGEKFYKMFNPINGTYKTAYHDNIVQSDDVKLFFSGKADILIIDKTIFHWYKKLFKNQDTYTFHPIFPEKKIYPVSFRDEKMRDIFNQGFAKLKKTGRYKEILDFYQTQNISEFIDYVNVLSAVASKYIYINDIEKLKKITPYFLSHPDIKAISIDSTSKNLLTLSKKDANLSLPCFERTIHYTEGSNITTVGVIKIYYSKNFKSANGVLIPPLSRFNDLSLIDFNLLKSIYAQYNLIDTDTLDLNKAERAYLKTHTTITVHNESLWAPYNFNDNGIPKGFSIDYMDLLAQKLHIHIKYISNYTWSEYLAKIKLEKIDVIANIVKTPERESYINFTSPYIKSRKAIFSNNKDLKSLNDLKNKTVAIPKSFFVEGYLKKHYPEIKIKTYKNSLECIIALTNKEADALIEDYTVVNDISKRNGLKIKYATIEKDENIVSNISLGVRKSQKILRDILQKAQNSVSTQEMEQLENKWFGLNDTPKQTYSKEQLKYLAEKKVLNICTNPTSKPIEFSFNNKPKGISIDIIDMVTKKIALKENFVQTSSWKESQEFLKAKKCDILVSAIQTKPREEYANFTRSYLSYDLAIVTRINEPLVDNISHVLDKKIALKEASGLATLLKNKYPNINILPTNDTIENLQKVKDGDAYFTIVSLPVLAYFQKKYNFDSLQVAGYSKLKLKLRIAVRDDDKQLLTILDKTLKSLPPESINLINQKWTSQEVIKVADYTMVWITILVSLVILLIVLLAYNKLHTLKKEIEQLNKTLENKVAEEIQKNRKKEKMMLHQSRLAQMGEMISMIAHQWRQPLNNLALLNQALVMKYNKEKLNQKFIEYFKNNSKKQIDNMSQTIDDFRNFFKSEKNKKDFYIKDILHGMIEIISPVFKANDISINLHLESNVSINGYPNELSQALLNIINNAKDALIENDIENKSIDITLSQDEQHIYLSILDNANGIPDEIMGKIFDPYFSTKTEKNGTGLGLYMSKIIIENHMNAKLSVAKKEHGTIFTIEFQKEAKFS